MNHCLFAEVAVSKMRAQERFDLQDAHKHHNRSDDEPELKGFVVTRLAVFMTILIFLFLLCAAVLLTYNFGICSNINVQSEVCDK